MDVVITIAELVRQLVRGVVAVVVIMLAIVAILDWLVRARHIKNAFHPVSRFLRRTVGPILRPVERRVVGAGGLPSAAPLWALAFSIIVGIVLITLVDFVLGQIIGGLFAARGGPRGLYVILVKWTIGIAQIAIIIRVLMSWFPISPYSKWVRWVFPVTEPILVPLRQFVPRIGMFDITPIVAFFLLRFLEWILLSFRF